MAQCTSIWAVSGGSDAASALDPHDCLVAPSSASDYNGDIDDEVRAGVSIITKGKQKVMLQYSTEHHKSMPPCWST